MRNLDINTPRGQEFREKEKELIEILQRRWKILIVETNKKKPALCDGFFVDLNTWEIRAVFEDKCRNLSFDELIQEGELIISSSKIDAGVQLSSLLRTSFIVIIYLLKDLRIVYWIVASDGALKFPIPEREVTTNESCNGGEATRMNSFLPCDKMTELKYELKND